MMVVMQNLNPSAAAPQRASNLAQTVFLLFLGAFSTATWTLVCAAEERTEAWDTGVYFVLLVPALAVLAFGVGWKYPARSWRWPLALVAGQALGLCITGSGSLELGPLPFLAFGVIAAPWLVAARLGAALGMRRARRASR